jgi:serine/threonine protein kinase
VKTVSQQDNLRFLASEANILSQLGTRHIIEFYTFDATKGYLAIEFMPGGDLRAYLRRNRPAPVPNENGYVTVELQPYVPEPNPTTRPWHEMAIEIADGMLYLSNREYIHNDLSAKNCLMTEDLTVKIGGIFFYFR